MRKYRLISFDMFQTLVDVATQKEAVMRAICSTSYSAELGDGIWEDANRFVYSFFHRMSEGQEEFKTVKDVFTACYASIFPKYGISLDPAVGAGILAGAHNEALAYEEVEDVFAGIASRYKTCLISDTDNAMVVGLLDRYRFDRVYTSEDFRAYKSSGSGVLFKRAIADFGISPEEMLHIGDGVSDVLGAKMVGADAAWVNRNKRNWEFPVKPDYVVENLAELPI